MHPTRPSLGLPGVLFAAVLVLPACAGATQQTQPSPQSSTRVVKRLSGQQASPIQEIWQSSRTQSAIAISKLVV